MNSFKKIVGINLLILLVYSLLIRFASMGSSPGDVSMSIAIFSAFAVGAHVLVSLVISLAKFADNNREGGRAWLGATGLVLLVGFSVCLGNASSVV